MLLHPSIKSDRTYVWKYQCHISNGNKHLVHCDVYFFLSVSKKNDDDIIMNQNIISFKMFIRNIFSDGMLSAIICIPLILAAIYRFVFPLIVQHYPMLKDFSLYYPILDLFLAIMCPYMICFASALVVLDETDMKINRYITITPTWEEGLSYIKIAYSCFICSYCFFCAAFFLFCIRYVIMDYIYNINIGYNTKRCGCYDYFGIRGK